MNESAEASGLRACRSHGQSSNPSNSSLNILRNACRWPRLGRLIAGRSPSFARFAACDRSKRPTDLKIWPSEAKYLREADFDVQKSPDPPKSDENNEKPKKKSEKKVRPKIFFGKCFSRQKIENCKSSETRFAEVSRRSEPCSQSSSSPRREFAKRKQFFPPTLVFN